MHRDSFTYRDLLREYIDVAGKAIESASPEHVEFIEAELNGKHVASMVYGLCRMIHDKSGMSLFTILGAVNHAATRIVVESVAQQHVAAAMPHVFEDEPDEPDDVPDSPTQESESP